MKKLAAIPVDDNDSNFRVCLVIHRTVYYRP
jgi:hypothetical protein